MSIPPEYLAALEVEHRLTLLEAGQREHGETLQRHDARLSSQSRDGQETARVLSTLNTHFQLIATRFWAVEAEQRRFILAAALTLGGIVVQFVRAKIGM